MFSKYSWEGGKVFNIMEDHQTPKKGNYHMQAALSFSFFKTATQCTPQHAIESWMGFPASVDLGVFCLQSSGTWGNSCSYAQLKCGELFPLLEVFENGLESSEGRERVICWMSQCQTWFISNASTAHLHNSSSKNFSWQAGVGWIASAGVKN